MQPPTEDQEAMFSDSLWQRRKKINSWLGRCEGDQVWQGCVRRPGSQGSISHDADRLAERHEVRARRHLQLNESLSA